MRQDYWNNQWSKFIPEAIDFNEFLKNSPEKSDKNFFHSCSGFDICSHFKSNLLSPIHLNLDKSREIFLNNSTVISLEDSSAGVLARQRWQLHQKGHFISDSRHGHPDAVPGICSGKR